MISFTTETATIYSKREQITKKRTEAQIQAQEFLNRGEKYNGFLSKKTAREVTKRVSNLLEIAEAGGRTVTFTTLTLPSIQVHSDEDIRRLMLGDFIRIIKQEYNVVNYIWKAEAQSNGNIHFHILADSYMNNVPVKQPSGYFTGEVNEIWNGIMGRYGYLDSYKLMIQLKEFRGDLTQDQINYQRQNNYSQPNSTDVHALYIKTKPEAYINKYIAKPEPNKRKITGRIVGCSDSLRYTVNYIDNQADNRENLLALQNMAQANPDKCHRIAIVIPQDRKEYLPNDQTDTVNFRTETAPNYPAFCAAQGSTPPAINTDQAAKKEIDKGIRKNFSELPSDKILCVKYYYTRELWAQYAPQAHKQHRNKYFDNLAQLHYLGVVN